MMRKFKFWIALLGLYGVLGGIVGLLYATTWADLGGADRQAILQHFGNQRIGAAQFVLLIALVVLGALFYGLYRHYVSATANLRQRLLFRIGGSKSSRLRPAGFAELCELTEAINQLTEQRDALRFDVAAKIDEAKAMVDEERRRLATLLAELAQSVIVCNLDGRILLYNNRARLLFQASERALVGLGRSIFGVLERNLIAHGLDAIVYRLGQGDAQAVTTFVTTTAAGQLIRVQMTPVLDPARAQAAAPTEERTVGGYVLILENITRNFEIESRRDMLLQSLTEGSRASLGNISAAVDNLTDYQDVDPEQRDKFLKAARDEVYAMRQWLDQNQEQSVGALKVRWPLEEMLGFDLVQAAQRRIEQRLKLPTKTEEIAEGLWVHVDSFSLLQGLTYLASRLQDEFNIREIRFRLTQAEQFAYFDLIWSGVVIGTETMIAWQMDPMSVGGENNPLTLNEVVARHGGELWFQREKTSFRSYFRILIPIAETPRKVDTHVASDEGRPEYYDFDLFAQADPARAQDDCLLSQLTYTVFDTETTGLDPSQGDEIIQIGAARIVNGRLLKREVFDQLVDPQRPVSRESTQIHGITGAMLAGQPTIDRVLPDFYAFCEDTVLVGHNAAFDMRFLQMKEAQTGIAFRQPLLDTLLLSAAISPELESHSLESIAERLGINIIGRHTALGDAIVAGEVFLGMIPLLAAHGIRTLREAREASERTYYAKVKY